MRHGKSDVPSVTRRDGTLLILKSLVAVRLGLNYCSSMYYRRSCKNHMNEAYASSRRPFDKFMFLTTGGGSITPERTPWTHGGDN